MKRLALIAVALVLAGCGSGEIDGDKLEAEVTKDAKERGVVLDGVACPSPEYEKGATFTCTVTVKGQDSELDVVQTDDDGHVSYHFIVIDGDKLEVEITKDAKERGIVLDGVTCPSPETNKGATFKCTVIVKGQPTELEVLQADDDGNVRYDFAGLVEGPAVNDTEADKASIDAVIDAVNKDITALCDYATREFRKELVGGENCAQAELAEYESPLIEDYQLSVNGDNAAAANDRHAVTFARQKNGSWLITDVR